MLIVAAIMLAGILAGYLLRGRKRILRLNSRMTMWTIYLLLFFMGMVIGHDEYIMQQLPELGFMAFIITIMAVLGSVSMAWLLWKLMFRKENQG
ncbi:MAG: LysO family transporter [Bacteroidota bacterium]